MMRLCSKFVCVRSGTLLFARAGTTMVEFAVVAGAFVALVLLTCEVSYQVTIDLALNFGARAASRFGMTGAAVPTGMTPAPASRAAAIQQLVVNATGGLLQSSRLALVETAYPSVPDFVTATAGSAGAGGPTQIVQYTLTYTQPYLTGIPALIMRQNFLAHHATVVVLNEPYPAS